MFLIHWLTRVQNFGLLALTPTTIHTSYQWLEFRLHLYLFSDFYCGAVQYLLLLITHQHRVLVFPLLKTEALKRLQVVESLREGNLNKENRPEWMILKVIPVIPPELGHLFRLMVEDLPLLT